uniref:Uncharacterized protein n=1 Tax=Naja naja TaxID=35670 RepID=A0A8C6X3J5_NAJNA
MAGHSSRTFRQFHVFSVIGRKNYLIFINVALSILLLRSRPKAWAPKIFHSLGFFT